jgi:transglutaminase-like putative cysteine protease
MAIHVALNHKTVYRYDRPIVMGPQVVRLRPAPHSRTPIISYSLKVSPAQHFINWQQDPQSNYLARLVFPEKTDHFTVEVDLVADMAVINPFDFFLEPSAEHYPFAYDHALDAELAPFRVCEPPGPPLAAWLASVPRKETHVVEFLTGLNQRLQQEIGYVIRMEPGVQTCEQTLGLAKGSCRDSAWLLVRILRHLGFAARFVSGYLLQLAPDQKSLDGPSGPERDFTDLHAWTEVYLPGAGWIGLDATSGLLVGEGHIPLACSPEPGSAARITGAHEKAEVEFEHHMTITRVLETARVTKPYTPEQWSRIQSLGEVIDSDLQRNDVRLTMGGEPTFVSIDDRDGAEWNTAALGPTKRRLAGDLMRRLSNRGHKGYLLHYGQGKWYPGEQLPRWALGCYWRKDGEPIWRNPGLLAGDEDKSRSVDHSTAARFAAVLAERLQIDPGHLIPAFEDSSYYLWRERRLPANVNPLQSKLKDPEERARLARLFDRGLDVSAGTLLPIERVHDGGAPRWVSGFWPTRSEQMFLIPGDSPMGYRLPLDALPWVSDTEYPWMFEQDPFEPRKPLPPRNEHQPMFEQRGRGGNGGGALAPRGQRLGPRGEDLMRQLHAARTSLRQGKSEPGIVRTALCVEPRDGLLHVFTPPVHENEDYLDLVAAIEDTAEDLGQKVMIEGYKPHSDPRLGHFSITPDPGVIEVNVQPSASWRELSERTTVLYEEARNSRLSTEKFMLDGRHVGTGGGNHVTLGGWSAADSPMLRRPDVLRSMIAYWHNHPALSYLFSGLFIGPTSQAPRVDEARNDAVYELEIALSQIEDFADTPPWFVDRVLRNVLTDVTGNTHRFGAGAAFHAVGLDVGCRNGAADQLFDGAEIALFLAGAEGERMAAGPGARGAADAVDIAFRVDGNIKIDNVRDAVDVDAAGGDVGGDERAHAAGAEVFQRALARTLRLVAVDGSSGVAVLLQVLDHAVGAVLGAGEDDRALQRRVERATASKARLSPHSTNSTRWSMRSTVVACGVTSTRTGWRRMPAASSAIACGMVAENSMVCRSTGNSLTILRMSRMKPMSSMRSASSSTSTLSASKRTWPCSIRSSRRPGVAITRSMPRTSAWTCGFWPTPPKITALLRPRCLP